MKFIVQEAYEGVNACILSFFPQNVLGISSKLFAARAMAFFRFLALCPRSQ
jgi:hypothetical protein